MITQKYLPPSIIVFLIVVLTTVGPFSTDMYLPALPDIVDFFNTSDAVLNMTLYGFLLFQAAGILLLGPISDKYGRKPVLMTSIAVYVAASLLAAVSSEIFFFIACRMIQGAASGGTLVISVALIKDCFDEKVRGKVLTLSVVLGVLGPVLSPVLGAFLIETINWQSTMVFPAAICILCLVLTFFFTESLDPNEKFTGSVPSVLKHMASLCKDKNFTVFLLAMCVFSLPFMAYLAVSSYIFVEGFGLGGPLYSCLLALNAVLGTTGMLIITRITKNRRGKLTGTIIILLSAVSGAVMLTVGSLNPVVCFVGMTFCVVAAFAARPYSLDLIMRRFKGDTGSVSSLFNFTIIFIGCLGMAAGTLPWSSYIVGLGVCSLFAAVFAAVFWRGKAVREFIEG